jgi:hypothetical protein
MALELSGKRRSADIRVCSGGRGFAECALARIDTQHYGIVHRHGL